VCEHIAIAGAPVVAGAPKEAVMSIEKRVKAYIDEIALDSSSDTRKRAFVALVNKRVSSKGALFGMRKIVEPDPEVADDGYCLASVDNCTCNRLEYPCEHVIACRVLE